jgi:hypothetical protein
MKKHGADVATLTVMPAKAGIQDLDPGSESGVTALSDTDAGDDT